jgi:hypothetical protein
MIPKRQPEIELKAQKLYDTLQQTSKEANQGFWSFLWTGFQTDEALLIQLMNTVPPVCGPYPGPTTPGNLEFSWVLYFLNIELPATGATGQWLQQKLTNDFDMPASTITAADWAAWQLVWKEEGVLLGDGTLTSTQIYAVMDPGWSLAVLDYIRMQIDLESVHAFNTEPNTVTVDPTTYPAISIAVIGDWGTGDYTDGTSGNSPSYKVMASIKKLAPDMVIHLGDVYYAGTNNLWVIKGEEQTKLLDAWQYNAPLGNFTLNSNHEMYSGANGYYDIALASPLFANQTAPNSSNPTSFFTINYGNCVILGLDSAYNATDKYMQGRITDASQPPIMAAAAGKQTIVFTHHNPIDLLGQTTNPLWTDVTGSGALNGKPYMWYWGHIHNGIVYNNTAPSGATLSRCLGNAAIPYGNAPWLSNQPAIDFYCNTPLGDTDPCNALRVKNAFAIITIQNNGTVTETWYDQDGNVSWTS